GIQALDLVGRKLTMDNGRLPWLLFEELTRDLAALEEAGFGDLAAELRPALSTLERATREMQARGPDERAAAATPYLQLFGQVLGGFLLARGARVAAGDPAGAAWPGLARFYATQLMPPALALAGPAFADPAALDEGLLPPAG
ncbi:MAG TPA: acyl-CoA dehydrogenase, partial [Rhodospirillales bacterium]|nr:acyl-CoA dehydrogenase [Rhodospirillales bacterium]